MLLQIFIQILVFGLVVLMAGIKSLRFLPSSLTDFELERQLKQGRDAAILESKIRQTRPLIMALGRVTNLLLTIIIIVLLGCGYGFWLAIVWAAIWLLIAELLETNGLLRSVSEEVADKYQIKLFAAVSFLSPFLKLVADRQLFDDERRVNFYSKEELMSVLADSRGILSQEEKLLIKQALIYDAVFIKDVMTPRSVLTVVKKTDTVGPLFLDNLHKTGQSRFPVIDQDLDHIVGMLYMYNMVPLSPKVKLVAEVMSPEVFYVHESKTLDHALSAFLQTKHHLFIVVNEFEETVGVLSIEDVLETIIGRKIVDEFDRHDDLRAVAKLAASKRAKKINHI